MHHAYYIVKICDLQSSVSLIMPAAKHTAVMTRHTSLLHAYSVPVPWVALMSKKHLESDVFDEPRLSLVCIRSMLFQHLCTLQGRGPLRVLTQWMYAPTFIRVYGVQDQNPCIWHQCCPPIPHGQKTLCFHAFCFVYYQKICKHAREDLNS